MRPQTVHFHMTRGASYQQSIGLTRDYIDEGNEDLYQGVFILRDRQSDLAAVRLTMTSNVIIPDEDELAAGAMPLYLQFDATSSQTATLPAVKRLAGYIDLKLKAGDPVRRLIDAYVSIGD